MQNKEGIIIGIPIYNEERTLYQTLSSVVDSAIQLDIEHDIIACFNGTTDMGREVARRFKDNVYSPLRIVESDKGKPKALKYIIDNSFGDYLIFCDGDVIVEEDCFSKLLRNFSNDEIMVVTGCPRPWPKDNTLYNILNARMMNPMSEIARELINGVSEKPFIHGRIYALRRKLFSDQGSGSFEKSIGDDTYLTHFIMKNYGRQAICRDVEAIVNYLPVQSLSSWWHKWARIWSDIEKIYKDNPELEELRPFMQTKLDWKYIFSLPLPAPLHFIAERVIHHTGKAYFTLTKHKQRGWKRLDDTKVIPK